MKTPLAIFLCLLVVCTAQGQKIAKDQQLAVEKADALSDLTESLAMEIWQHAELPLTEHKSSQLLQSVLEKEGFALKVGVSDMPTAFVATFGSGSPVIGILAEFDALPGIGNEAVPAKVPRADGVTSGHGCGHNLFGPGSTIAAIALKRTMEEKGIKGTLVLFGTPAEEIGVGKVYMARDGYFDGLDAVLEWHASTQTEVRNVSSIAINNFEVEFFGQSAHAAGDPWNGRSALDALEMMNFGVNLMREHVEPTSRIHYVIKSGGEAPNVVPDYAKVWYFVRDKDRETVDKNYARILNIAAGAALATGTTHKVNLISGVYSYLLNRPLQLAMQSNLEWIGGPDYTAEEQEWAKKLQTSADKPTLGFDGAVIPLADGYLKSMGGPSTDAADVSQIVPTVGLRVTTAPVDVPWHSWATVASHGTYAGVKGAIVASKVLAATGIDLFTQPQLLKDAKAEFDKMKNGKVYQTPLTKDQKPPIPQIEN